MSSNEEKEDNEDVMINTPEGFDARTMCFTQPSSLGMSIRLVIKSNLTPSVSEPNLLKAMDLKQPSVLRSSLREADTTSRYSSTKGS
jgi:hypothetical protein